MNYFINKIEILKHFIQYDRIFSVGKRKMKILLLKQHILNVGAICKISISFNLHMYIRYNEMPWFLYIYLFQFFICGAFFEEKISYLIRIFTGNWEKPSKNPLSDMKIVTSIYYFIKKKIIIDYFSVRISLYKTALRFIQNTCIFSFCL